MASYIDNISANAQVKGPQPFVPDWSFLSKAQTQLTEMQRRGFESFRSQYSPLLNSNLTSPESIALRKEFKDKADKTIDRITGMDLTDPRNVAAAKGVLQPLLQNQNYVHDVGFTRQAENAMREASMVQFAADENTRKTYNINSIKDIQYTMQDYAQADADARLGFSAPRYVPGVDYVGLALKYFKANDWDYKNVTIGGSPGQQYIVTTEGGEAQTQDIYSFVMANFQNDPLVQANLQLEAKIGLRDYVETNLNAYGGDRTAASIGYVKELYNGFGKEAKKTLLEDNEYLGALMHTKQVMDSRPQTNNTERLSYREKLEASLNNQEAKVSDLNYELPENPTMDDVRKAVSLFTNVKFNQQMLGLSNVFARSTGGITDIKQDPYSYYAYQKKVDAYYEALTANQNALGSRGQRVAQGIDAAQSENVNRGEAMQVNQQAIAQTETKALADNVDVLIEYAKLDGNVVYTDDNGKTIPLTREALSKLSPAKLKGYTVQAQTAVMSGAYDLNFNDDVTTQAETVKLKLDQFNRSAETASLLRNVEKSNMLEAVTKYDPNTGGGDVKVKERTLAKDLITYIISEENIINPEQLQQRFSEIYNDKDLLENIANSKLGGIAQYVPTPGPTDNVQGGNVLSGLFETVGRVFDYFNDEGEDLFVDVFGGWELSSPRTWFDGDVGTVKDYYYKDQGATSLQGLLQGIDDAGVGGLEVYSTLLGNANNNVPNMVNTAIDMAYSAYLQDKATVYVGGIPATLQGEAESPEGTEALLRDYVTFMKTNTAKTSPQLSPVQVYEDSEGKQYMNIRMPEKFMDQVVGSESTPGYFRGEQAVNVRRDGITIALDPSGALPEQLLGNRLSNEEILLNASGGSYNFGGNYLDGGKLNLIRTDEGYSIRGHIFEYNPQTGSYDSIPVGNELTNKIQGRSAAEAFNYIDQILTANRMKNIKLEKGE